MAGRRRGGTVVLASDALHFYEEVERDRPFAILADLPAMYRAYDTLAQLASPAGHRTWSPGTTRRSATASPATPGAAAGPRQPPDPEATDLTRRACRGASAVRPDALARARSRIAYALAVDGHQRAVRQVRVGVPWRRRRAAPRSRGTAASRRSRGRSSAPRRRRRSTTPSTPGRRSATRPGWCPCMTWNGSFSYTGKVPTAVGATPMPVFAGEENTSCPLCQMVSVSGSDSLAIA